MAVVLGLGFLSTSNRNSSRRGRLVRTSTWPISTPTLTSVVVDSGCWMWHWNLSIFCSQAGAEWENEVVKAKNLSDTVIVLHGQVEDVEIDEEIDVIISEWIRYMLLYEVVMSLLSNRFLVNYIHLLVMLAL
ncbi:hypothetical protein FNV43_RR00725 [Rhamnella rubrinervis]|uniref:Uncharacterized protein n=1 Tax=Rhamnella rubrinervis TaxID=2594499 RepID=A0A8K0MRN5_9ROSA|nr:hypothetical protein FNV43_RR00725 [Rhamnella rubrinervis]